MKDSLLADADLENFDPNAYFAGSAVTLKAFERSEPINTAIPEIKGQILLEGESGLGKTMFLRHLVQGSRRPVVYLPAGKCTGGVLEAMQAKLHGYARDENFLRSLIYSGAIDVCIDGLNEASPDTRAQVSAFMESNFKGNIILGTQPMEWTSPSTAQVYILGPLSREQIETFLLSRKDVLPGGARVYGDDYQERCRDYLAQALAPEQPREVLGGIERVLSNPMDLTVIALMLAQGEKPELFHLQEQQYQIMANDYKRVNVGQEFPRKRFSEQVYQMRVNDEAAIPEQAFQEELLCMERHKMVARRQLLNQSKEVITEWNFRHDKIMDFFLVQTFLGTSNERPQPQQPPDLIDERRPLSYHPASDPMQHLDILLGLRVDRYKAHPRPADYLANRLRVNV